MTTKQRDVTFQRWSGVILRETRDLASLEQVGAQAMNDLDVRDDDTLQCMIRAEMEERRNRIEQELQSQASSKTRQESKPDSRSEIREPIPAVTPEIIRDNFHRLSRTLCASLERGDDSATSSTLERLRALQAESTGLIPPTAVSECESRVEELRKHVQHLRDRIATSTEQSVAAARRGNQEELARAMRRLVAIHAAHPTLLTEAQLNDIRNGAVRAAEERSQHQVITRKLLDRERTISSQIKGLAASVHAFHQVACTLPDSSSEFQEAEAAYLRAIREVRTYDTEWFLGVVLELADLLAEWTLPPLAAQGQIDRFLDSIHAGVERIRVEMREIETEQDSKASGALTSETP
jgi:hypothetical protein